MKPKPKKLCPFCLLPGTHSACNRSMKRHAKQLGLLVGSIAGQLVAKALTR